MENNVVFLTVLNKETPGYIRLLRSAHKFGIPLRSFFFDEPDYDRFISKKHLFIQEGLRSVWKTSDVSRFMYVDAFDTCFVSRPHISIFTEQNLVFGGEKICYPEAAYDQLYDVSGEFPYLNSGVIWGKIGLYMHYCPTEVGHDQLLWTRKYFDTGRASGMVIDTAGKVALNMHSTAQEDFTRYPDGVRYAQGGNDLQAVWPTVLHANGKWPMPSWCGL
jgi:hypothetical protein